MEKNEIVMNEDDIIKIPTIRIATWNLLADGLAEGEFLSDKGDNIVTNWNARSDRITSTLCEMFDVGKVGIISTQENDHPELLLSNLKDTHTHIEMIKVLKYYEEFDNSKKDSTCLKNLRKRYSKDFNRFGGIDGIQNDTLSIYYNSQICEPVSDVTQFVIDYNEKKDLSTLAGFIVFQMTADTNMKFAVVNTHLSSGEKVDDAIQRLKESKKIIDFIEGKKQEEQDLLNIPIIITMDSNSSDFYPSNSGGNNDDVNTFFTLNKWKNLVPYKGNECYKMRHGAGGQPNKFGKLIYDTIDKIFISSSTSSVETNSHYVSLNQCTPTTFNKVNETFTNEECLYIYNLRRNDEQREKLEELVRYEKWSDIVGLGKSVPTGYKYIEKKGEITKVSLYNGKNFVDGKEVDGEIYQGDIPIKDNEILPQRLQLGLYPNSRNPSDHPPCVADVALNN